MKDLIKQDTFGCACFELCITLLLLKYISVGQKLDILDFYTVIEADGL